MRIKLTLTGAAIAVLFWACGDGTISTKSDDDALMLATYANPDGLVLLEGHVSEALAACNDDPVCLAAVEAATKVKESSSSADSTTADSLANLSSGAGSSGSGPLSSGATSGSSGAAGSSSGTAGSSGSLGSSSSAATVSSSSAPPATNVDGTCAPPGRDIVYGLEKGVATTWSFKNSTSLTAETYDWTFDEGASIAVSTDASPSVSYTKPGKHVAKLIVNKGKPTASKEITCQTVKVVGTKVKNCECTTTTTGPIDVTDNAQDVTWTVSGCSTDGGDLKYTWGTDVTANGTSATKTISTGGTHAPKVTVTNAEDMDTIVTCQAVTATAPITANCYLSGDANAHWKEHGTHPYSTAPGGSFYFAPIDVEGSDSIGIPMTVTVNNGSSKPITVKWGNATAATQLTAPSDTGSYPVTLSDNGREVCSATLTVAWPKITATGCSISSSNKFNPGTSFSGWDDGAIGQNVSMDLYRDDEKLRSFTVNKYYNNPNNLPTVSVPSAAGTYNFRLVYQGNEVCKIAKTVALVETSCNIGAVGSASNSSYTAIPGQIFAFKPGDSNHPGGATRSMSLEFNGTTQTIDVKPSGNDETTLEAPTALSSYDVVLKYGNNQVCKATLKVDYPKPSCNIGKDGSSATSSSYTALGGKTFVFKPGDYSFVGSIGMDLTFNGNTQSITVKPSGNTATSLTAPNTSGNLPVTLKYGTNQVCSATLTVLTDADFDEVTATGTYSGSKKIKFVNTKTCGVTTSSSAWNTWVIDGTIAGYWGGANGHISGTMYIDIPSGQSFTIGDCW